MQGNSVALRVVSQSNPHGRSQLQLRFFDLGMATGAIYIAMANLNGADLEARLLAALKDMAACVSRIEQLEPADVYGLAKEFCFHLKNYRKAVLRGVSKCHDADEPSCRLGSPWERVSEAVSRLRAFEDFQMQPERPDIFECRWIAVGRTVAWLKSCGENGTAIKAPSEARTRFNALLVFAGASATDAEAIIEKGSSNSLGSLEEVVREYLRKTGNDFWVYNPNGTCFVNGVEVSEPDFRVLAALRRADGRRISYDYLAEQSRVSRANLILGKLRRTKGIAHFLGCIRDRRWLDLSAPMPPNLD